MAQISEYHFYLHTSRGTSSNKYYNNVILVITWQEKNILFYKWFPLQRLVLTSNILQGKQNKKYFLLWSLCFEISD